AGGGGGAGGRGAGRRRCRRVEGVGRAGRAGRGQCRQCEPVRGDVVAETDERLVLKGRNVDRHGRADCGAARVRRSVGGRRRVAVGVRIELDRAGVGDDYQVQVGEHGGGGVGGDVEGGPGRV